jgi:hypothetical protein
VFTVSFAILAIGGVAWAAGDWNSAKTKVDEFNRKEQDPHRQAPEQTRRIVSAICAASQDNRRSAGSSAASSARSRISDSYGELERLERDAASMLKDVERDDKQHQSEASSLESQLASKWDRVRDYTRELLNGEPPVVQWMVSHGESAIRDRGSRCDAHDVSLSGGRAACLVASGSTCRVVEFAPDNSSAISSARDRAHRFQSQLDDEARKPGSDVMTTLARSRSGFASCKHFEAQVECYSQCPDVGDDNHVRETSASWRTGC